MLLLAVLSMFLLLVAQTMIGRRYALPVASRQAPLGPMTPTFSDRSRPAVTAAARHPHLDGATPRPGG